MAKIWLSVVAVLSISASYVMSQNYPFLRDVRVESSVSYTQSSKIFSYSYHLANGRRSQGSIQEFDIDISRRVGSLGLDTTGLKFNSGLEEGYFRRRYPGLCERIVPVGFPGRPGNEWIGMLTNRRTASISADTLFIKPGQSTGGITITSRGVPGIRALVIRPNFQDDVLFPSIDDTSRTLSIAQMDSIREAANFYTRTVGPTAPPVKFVATIWIDTLLSYTRQSADLGWLGRDRDNDCDDDERPDDGVVKNIEKRLEKAKRFLERDDSVKARRELEKLVQKVERIWKRSQDQEKKRGRGKEWRQDKCLMTSEAYALLKYNTEYVIDHLPEKERPEPRKPKKRERD